VSRSLHIEPDKATFERLADEWPMVPVWTELTTDVSTPVGLFPGLCHRGPGALLESVERSERWGRYSFVAGDPAAVVTGDAGGVRVDAVRRDLPIDEGAVAGPPLAALSDVARRLRGPRIEQLPALSGGLIGMLAYEAASIIDGSPHPGPATTDPPIALLVLDRAVVFDHWRQRLLLIAHTPSRVGLDGGRAALEELAERVTAGSSLHPEPLEPAEAPVPAGGEADRGSFVDSVARAREHILAGDIFQVVLSRRSQFPAPSGALPIYRRLRIANPAPYMFLLRLPGMELAGSSPEPLIRVEGGRVTTRPIAGTRPRGRTPDQDEDLERDLLADPKERAEHAMLVDLARNDLGRVCRAGTVRVSELMTVERFSRVMHIVSTVEGELRHGLGALDALAATFPAGTVTGAPKRRAMEIIAEEESHARGPYAGAVGYLTFSGDLDFCITIRTAVVQEGTATVQAGAGIVADSDPGREYEETRAKASALLTAVGAPEEALR
jgi:anthranilate synthase component I